MNAIETSGLTKYYGRSRGIVDVDLTVAEGDFFGFIGPNGAGKSTTIRTLLGLIAPTAGQAALFGRDVTKHKTELLARVGYLPSETMFYSGMTVKEILAFSAGLRRRDCTAEAKRLCERLELDGSQRVERLSLGNRKKVGIVCALQHEPDLYILDEPTSGLDPLMQRAFYDLLEERNRAGATVFLSSHILSDVGRYCRTAAVIREGRILACDRVEALGHTGTKRVTLRGVTPELSVPGAVNVTREEGTLTFLYDGAPAELVRVLSGLEFEDFTVTDPDLEEIFMHYYGKEGEEYDPVLA